MRAMVLMIASGGVPGPVGTSMTSRTSAFGQPAVRGSSFDDPAVAPDQEVAAGLPGCPAGLVLSKLDRAFPGASTGPASKGSADAIRLIQKDN
jgi:hypothetical protein